MQNEIKKTTEGGKRSVEVGVSIGAPIEAVWDALTRADKLVSWFPLKAEVTPGAQGSMLTAWGEDQAWPSPITIWEPNRHLRALWCDRATPEAEQFGVDFFLTKDGESRTRLRLVHFGFGAEPMWDGMYDGVCRGWDTMLWGLKHYLERHPREQRRVVYLRAVYPGGESAQGWGAFFSPGGPFAVAGVGELKPESSFTGTVSGERSVRGVVRTCRRGVDFQALVPEMGDGLLRVQTDACKSGAGEELSVTLATFGLDEGQRRAIAEKWAAALRALPGVSEVKVGSIGVAAFDGAAAPTRSVERHMTIKAPVEAVWDALTTARELMRWFPRRASVEGLHPGAKMGWEWDPKTVWTLTVKEVHPPRRIVLEDAWTPAHTGAGAAAEPLVLAIDLDPTPDGSTYLHLVHSGFGGGSSWNNRYDGVSGGWTCELAGLKHYLEAHRGKDRAFVWINHAASGDAEQAWEKLSGPEGFALRELPGKRLSAKLPGFGSVSGLELARVPGKAVVFEAQELDGSRIGITFEPDGCGDGKQSAMIWLSLYGKGAARAAELERAVKEQLDALFS